MSYDPAAGKRNVKPPWHMDLLHAFDFTGALCTGPPTSGHRLCSQLDARLPDNFGVFTNLFGGSGPDATAEESSSGGGKPPLPSVPPFNEPSLAAGGAPSLAAGGEPSLAAGGDDQISALDLMDVIKNDDHKLAPPATDERASELSGLSELSLTELSDETQKQILGLVEGDGMAVLYENMLLAPAVEQKWPMEVAAEEATARAQRAAGSLAAAADCSVTADASPMKRCKFDHAQFSGSGGQVPPVAAVAMSLESRAAARMAQLKVEVEAHACLPPSVPEVEATPPLAELPIVEPIAELPTTTRARSWAPQYMGPQHRPKKTVNAATKCADEQWLKNTFKH